MTQSVVDGHRRHSGWIAEPQKHSVPTLNVDIELAGSSIAFRICGRDPDHMISWWEWWPLHRIAGHGHVPSTVVTCCRVLPGQNHSWAKRTWELLLVWWTSVGKFGWFHIWNIHECMDHIATQVVMLRKQPPPTWFHRERGVLWTAADSVND